MINEEDDPRYAQIPESLREIFKHLENSFIALCFRWRFYRQLYRVSEERVELLNRLGAVFFAELQEILIQDVVVGICRLTDPASQGKFENCVLAQLTVRLDGNVHGALKKALSDQLDKLRVITSDIRFLRDKVLAHADLPTVTHVHDTPMPGVSAAQIDAAIEMVHNILTAFRLHFLQTEQDYDGLVTPGDARTLVYALSLANEYIEMSKSDPELIARGRRSKYCPKPDERR